MRKGWEITGWIALAVGLVLLVPSLYLSLATPKVVTVEKTVERTEMIVPKRGVSMY